MRRLPCRPVYAQAALVVVLALVGISLVSDAPLAAAAPNLAGGALVLAVAGLLARAEPLRRARTLALLLAFGIGGIGLWYLGLAALDVFERSLALQLLTDTALLVGLGLFVLDEGPAAQ